MQSGVAWCSLRDGCLAARHNLRWADRGLVSLVIHTAVSIEEAVAAFAPVRPPARFLDDAFFVLDRAVLCFFTIAPCTGAQLMSPRHLRWSPAGGPVRGGDQAWWPRPVVDVYDRSGPKFKRLRDHHIFLRSPDDDKHLYSGAAHLAGYAADRTADFELSEVLPRPIWLRFGGYEGWRVEVAHQERDVAVGDEAALNAQLEAFAARPFSHLALTRYENDILHLYKNERRAWLMYLREPDDSGLYVSAPRESTAIASEAFHCDCGIDLTAPAEQTLDLAQALEVVRFLFRSGSLPRDVAWTDNF